MSEREPLWTDDAIEWFLDLVPEHWRSEARQILTNRRDTYQARLRAVEQERDELRRVIAYLDSHAPVADSTCDEPGITLSEAARRALADESEAHEGEAYRPGKYYDLAPGGKEFYAELQRASKGSNDAD